jgi:hypothetical protein
MENIQVLKFDPDPEIFVNIFFLYLYCNLFNMVNTILENYSV